ncbi:hypothetical protein [Shewanella sp. TB4-MNA-CIBAN-0142]|uniref:hypothetical protein n=1 Tax=Shewanella sp. TB4-MNA-CIBAN-0142 TaxID=3140464 RepID=UPI00331D1AA1
MDDNTEKVGLNLDELRKKLRSELVQRHEGQYRAVNSLEGHILPFEDELRKQTKQWFEEKKPIDFLYQPKDGRSPKAIILKDLRTACETFYSNKETGEDTYHYAKLTITDHIKTITGKSLTKWTQGIHAQDAFKTAYLLYQLHFTTQSGLEMLTKKGDARFIEVELFTGHHKPKNSNSLPEDDQVILLSSWLKEFFSKSLFHRSETERAILKNLDIIFTGYNDIFQFIANTKSDKKALFAQIFDTNIIKKEEKPNEELSITLMRNWQESRKHHTNSNQLSKSLINAFLQATQRTNRPQIPSNKDLEILQLGARLFSWQLFRLDLRNTFKTLSEEEMLQLMGKASLREKDIYSYFKTDYENRIQLVAKGISKDSKRTSLMKTLEFLVENNSKILQEPLASNVVLNLDHNCDLHYNYLFFRAYHACFFPTKSMEEFITDRQRENERLNQQAAWVQAYINKMTINELHQDILRVNDLMSEMTGGRFKLVQQASSSIRENLT